MAVADHGRRRYQQGCRCDQCRLAEAEYQKRNRQRRAAKALKAVQDQPESDDTEPSEDAAGPVSVVAAVALEVDGLAGVDGKPGLVATALAMAKILDNPVAIAQHPAAAARLMDLMSDLRKGGKKQHGKLAAARDMIG